MEYSMAKRIMFTGSSTVFPNPLKCGGFTGNPRRP